MALHQANRAVPRAPRTLYCPKPTVTRRQWVLHLGRITQWVIPRPQDPDFGRGPWMDMCILEMMHALRTATFDNHYAHLTPQRSEALLRQHAEEICAEAWGRGTQGRRARHQYLVSLPPQRPA